ncbi:MAG: ATPase, T2SS/T4P/T4SS family [Peptostreptococcaceae bacterium]|nr:ATPase, T2SS/T4P/T4SS family [Peptostreptococcaceae bacterium]
MRKKQRLGDILVNHNMITPEQLEKALAAQKESKKKLGEVLIDLGIIDENIILKTLEAQLKIPYINLNEYIINPNAVKIISENIARRYNIIPLNVEDGKILLSMSDPLDVLAVDDVQVITGLSVKVVISSKSDIQKAISKYFDSSESAQEAVKEFDSQFREIEEDQDEEADDVANAPIVRLVNSMISQAARLRASDIHIEPFEDMVRIRFRIDGELVENMVLPRKTHSALITRIKIIGKLDIAERRIPQDGRVETVVDRIPIDLRISILPTVYGEKVVMRLLFRNAISVTKEQLGFTAYNLELFDKIIKAPEGIILVTGPTGSGKSTTLYTVLRELNDIKKNIITIEDPVEYRLEGINQVQVNTKAGLTFASGLRSVLRQDPDIVMVGEIRDAETAQIATRAAITGHLVLSTLHTNDTASTISRFIDMGVESYMVSSSVIGVIAQRLVRRICTRCKEVHELTDEEKLITKDLGVNVAYKGKGCNYCSGSGYAGRIAIHEILVMDRDIRRMIDRGNAIDEIKEEAIKKGMKTLNKTCVDLINEGITTIDEMLKITYSVDQ